ncbi:olfactory receptor 10C1-like [Hyperolius riggenbachi]|uniref:olfactory receptor 10C1-like n=1 Tax=Hyperolius riggenbachi TaxID=752182 RepID=UPI0035A363FB
MYAGNQSTVTEFILLGLSEDPLVQIVLFHMFLVAYITTLAGNLLLILAVRTDKRLHNSMYLFLANLSFLDICYTSVIVPKMLVDLLYLKKSISYIGCAFQVFFYLFLGETECILLALMAYDRYVAICHPLRYNMMMNTTVCLWMISTSWWTACMISSVDIYFVLSLTYCGPNTINHFFCEVPLLMQLSCSDTSSVNILKLMGSAILLFIPFLLILISYFRIMVAIARIPTGKYKSFSACSSHLVAVIILYGTAMFMYVRPEHFAKEGTDKLVAVFYTVITPMINPLIYSLRNKDVHRAMKRALRAGQMELSSLPISRHKFAMLL